METNDGKVCSVNDGNPSVVFGFSGLKFSLVINFSAINMPNILINISVHNFITLTETP